MPRAIAAGAFCYLRDLDSGAFWSTAWQPTLKPAKRYQAIFTQARAEFRRSDDQIDTHTEISVSPEDDIELRRITLTNRSEVAAHHRGDQLCRGRAGAARPTICRTRRSATCSCRPNWCAIGRRSSARAGRARPRSGRRG